MNILGIVFVAVLVATVVCGLIGTFGEQFDRNNFNLFLYKSQVGNSKTYFVDITFGCEASGQRFAAALAFAIIGWIAALVAAVCAIVLIFSKAVPRIIILIASCIAFVAMLFGWILTLVVFMGKPCDARNSYDSAGYTLSYGFAFQIMAWVLAAVSAVLAFLTRASE